MTFTDLIHQPYDVFLFDAYGVLVNSSGAIPGAAAALDRVRAAGRNYFVLTNDASRTPLAASLFYQKCGLQIQPSQIVTAGLAIEAALREIRNLNGLSRSLVMGTADTVAMVQNAGHQIIEIDAHADFDVLVIGDDSGFDLLVSLNAIISALHR